MAVENNHFVEVLGGSFIFGFGKLNVGIAAYPRFKIEALKVRHGAAQCQHNAVVVLQRVRGRLKGFPLPSSLRMKLVCCAGQTQLFSWNARTNDGRLRCFFHLSSSLKPTICAVAFLDLFPAATRASFVSAYLLSHSIHVHGFKGVALDHECAAWKGSRAGKRHKAGSSQRHPCEPWKGGL